MSAGSAWAGAGRGGVPASAPACDGKPASLTRRAALGLALAGALSASGCARYYYGARAGGGSGASVDLVETSYQAADRLLLGPPLDPAQPVLVATLVNVDQLNESSRLGRLISEQIAGRLAQRGARVTELKLRETLAMRPGQGELLLSRELRDVSKAQSAQAVVVGTYAVSPHAVYVSVKRVDPSGNAVVAAYDYALPMDDNLRGLLANR